MSAAFPNPRTAMAQPQYWDQYMPQPGDFLTADAYHAAMEEYRLAARGPQAFQAPTNDPATGMRTAGVSDPGRLAMSQGDYSANLLNTRLMQAEPGSADAKMFGLAMASRAQVRPEEMQAAYESMTNDYRPTLLDPLAAMLERYGIRPTDYSPGNGLTDATIDSPGGGAFAGSLPGDSAMHAPYTPGQYTPGQEPSRDLKKQPRGTTTSDFNRDRPGSGGVSLADLVRMNPKPPYVPYLPYGY